MQRETDCGHCLRSKRRSSLLLRCLDLVKCHTSAKFEFVMLWYSAACTFSDISSIPCSQVPGTCGLFSIRNYHARSPCTLAARRNEGQFFRVAVPICLRTGKAALADPVQHARSDTRDLCNEMLLPVLSPTQCTINAGTVRF